MEQSVVYMYNAKVLYDINSKSNYGVIYRTKYNQIFRFNEKYSGKSGKLRIDGYNIYNMKYGICIQVSVRKHQSVAEGRA